MKKNQIELWILVVTVILILSVGVYLFSGKNIGLVTRPSQTSQTAEQTINPPPNISISIPYYTLSTSLDFPDSLALSDSMGSTIKVGLVKPKTGQSIKNGEYWIDGKKISERIRLGEGDVQDVLFDDALFPLGMEDGSHTLKVVLRTQESGDSSNKLHSFTLKKSFLVDSISPTTVPLGNDQVQVTDAGSGLSDADLVIYKVSPAPNYELTLSEQKEIVCTGSDSSKTCSLTVPGKTILAIFSDKVHNVSLYSFNVPLQTIFDAHDATEKSPSTAVKAKTASPAKQLNLQDLTCIPPKIEIVILDESGQEYPSVYWSPYWKVFNSRQAVLMAQDLLNEKITDYGFVPIPFQPSHITLYTSHVDYFYGHPKNALLGNDVTVIPIDLLDQVKFKGIDYGSAIYKSEYYGTVLLTEYFIGAGNIPFWAEYKDTIVLGNEGTIATPFAEAHKTANNVIPIIITDKYGGYVDEWESSEGEKIPGKLYLGDTAGSANTSEGLVGIYGYLDEIVYSSMGFPLSTKLKAWSEVMAHELGHEFGLGHDTMDPFGLMFWKAGGVLASHNQISFVQAARMIEGLCTDGLKVEKAGVTEIMSTYSFPCGDNGLDQLSSNNEHCEGNDSGRDKPEKISSKKVSQFCPIREGLVIPIAVDWTNVFDLAAQGYQINYCVPPKTAGFNGCSCIPADITGSANPPWPFPTDSVLPEVGEDVITPSPNRPVTGAGNYCGDGKVNALTEECDGSALDCDTPPEGKIVQCVKCSCELEDKAPQSLCGNRQLDKGEGCDPTAINGEASKACGEPPPDGTYTCDQCQCKVQYLCSGQYTDKAPQCNTAKDCETLFGPAPTGSALVCIQCLCHWTTISSTGET